MSPPAWVSWKWRTISGVMVAPGIPKTRRKPMSSSRVIFVVIPRGCRRGIHGSPTVTFGDDRRLRGQLYRRKRFLLREKAAQSDFHAFCKFFTGWPASIAFRIESVPQRISNGNFSVSYSYGGFRQANADS